MTKRAAPILLFTLLLGGASVGRHGTSSQGPQPAEPATSAGSILGGDANARVIAVMPPSVAMPMEELRSDTANKARVAISADASALLAEQVALQMLAADAGLELTPAQWAALAAVTLQHQAIRQAYEATIAVATQAEQGRYRLEIPAYPFAGDALRDRFHAELRAQLGSGVAEEIVARLGTRLEGHFAGFGVSVQALDFIADRDVQGTNYRVTRTVQFWNSVEGASRLTTRRETHFPRVEDPAGITWGPFLSLLAARAGS